MDAIISGHAYEWLVVAGAFGALLFGFATGSNDVANAFATSVGARTLKLWQAVCIAAVFEFAGALLLGRVQTETIAGGIADIQAFTRTPEIYAYGMVCALFVGGAWQLLASYLELNVSATHSIIGGIMGFGLVHAGKHGVIWAQRDPGAFPPYKGVVAIILSWIFSPVLCALAAIFIFQITKYAVLRRKNAYSLSFILLPFFVLVTTWINVFFILLKGARKLLASEDNSWTAQKAAWVSAIAAGGAAAVTALVIAPLLKRRINRVFDQEGNRIVDPEVGQEAVVTEASFTDGAHSSEKPANNDELSHTVMPSAVKAPTRFHRLKKAALHGVTYDIHAIVDKDENLRALHDRAEVFEPRVEMSFSYLQVFSAICVIFAHGAGEVGYMAGPLTTIWYNYKEGFLAKTRNPPIWILVIGAASLVLGLATYGYKVTRAMGVRLAKISPTRGFAAELATALVITLASQYKLPTSSSQCITGAIVGIGLADGFKGVNWRQFGRQMVAWILTLAVVGFFTAALFSQAVYAPSEIDSKAVISYEDRLVTLSEGIYKELNSTLYTFQGTAQAGDLPRLSQTQWQSLNTSLADSFASAKMLTDLKKVQTVEANAVIDTFVEALWMLQNYTVITLGQSNIFPGAQSCTTRNGSADGVCFAPNIIR